jgi:transketolase
MGGMVRVLLDTLPALAEHGIHPTVVNLSSLPVDAAAVQRLAARHGLVFAIEDHFVKGGISDELSRTLLQMDSPVRFGSWGVQDYGQAGAPDDLYARYRLDSEGIVSLLRSFVHEHHSK